MPNPGDDARRRLIEKEKSRQLIVIQEFKKIQNRVALEMRDLLVQIEHERTTTGNAPTNLLIRQARLRMLLTQISDEIAKTSTRLGIVTADSQRSAIGIAETEAGKNAQLRTDLAFFDSDATRELIGVAGDGGPLSKVFARIGQPVRQRVFDALFYGIAAGKGNASIAREINDAIGSGAANAMTIVRTETNRAYREATRKFYDVTPAVIGWRWLAALDLRTCPICWALHNKVFQTDVKMATHPNCRCTMVPVFSNDPRPKTGPEFFAELNLDQQRAILGPARSALYNQGAELSDFVEKHATPFGPGRRIIPLERVQFKQRSRTPAPRAFADVVRRPSPSTTPKPASPAVDIPNSFAAGDPVPDFDSWSDAET